jgi:hypothetical protein
MNRGFVFIPAQRDLAEFGQKPEGSLTREFASRIGKQKFFPWYRWNYGAVQSIQFSSQQQSRLPAPRRFPDVLKTVVGEAQKW